MANITILGAGGFGISLAVLFNQYGHSLTMWSHNEQEVENLKKYGENKKLLPDVIISKDIDLTNDLNCVKNADIVIFAVPSVAVREVANKFKNYINSKSVLINVAKGLEQNTHKRLSEVLKDVYPNNSIVILTGPSHAEEIAREVPTTIVVSSENQQSSIYIQEQLMNKTLRIYVNHDLIGVEYGGALKNIIAVCAGICDGIKLGDNSKAALITRGIAEIGRLGTALGGKIETFAGLTGIGDLIVTCMSNHSRNRLAGNIIGEGFNMEQTIEKIGKTVEGFVTTKVAYELAKEKNIQMPIVEQLYYVLYKNKDVKIALNDLMDRPKRNECEKIWLESL